jgi:hypothetical protein
MTTNIFEGFKILNPLKFYEKRPETSKVVAAGRKEKNLVPHRIFCLFSHTNARWPAT